MQEYYHQHDLHRSKAYLAVKAAYDSETTADLTASLREALELYSQDKSDGGFMAAATEDQLRLITFQQKMASKHNVTLTGMSVSDTLFLCVGEWELKDRAVTSKGNSKTAREILKWGDVILLVKREGH